MITIPCVRACLTPSVRKFAKRSMSSCLSSDSKTFESQEGTEELPVHAREDWDTLDTPEAGRVNPWSGFSPTRVTPRNSSNITSSSTYDTSRAAAKRSSARREAELIHARGRISQLELELSKCQHAAKRARLEASQEEEGERSTTTSQELRRLHTVG